MHGPGIGVRLICRSPAAPTGGRLMQKGPYVAETFPVRVEDNCVVVEV
ncbi:hypothetical protein I6F35_30075 [Bradyrhizobium sp. BRP22]|nr:hypothetical protein [Bradyrhizobium sp. BRP22]MCA1457392.1 hypothetical protein [Bradyrhizobium sp. BRP22]